MGDSILDQFTQQLQDKLKKADIRITRWTGGKRQSANILILKFPHEGLLLYVKVRSKQPGFWGLTRNRVAEIEETGLRWYAVLLLASPEFGYLLPAEEILRRIRQEEWKLSNDGDYKINEGKTLDTSFGFSSLNELLDLLS